MRSALDGFRVIIFKLDFANWSPVECHTCLELLSRLESEWCADTHNEDFISRKWALSISETSNVEPQVQDTKIPTQKSLIDLQLESKHSEEVRKLTEADICEDNIFVRADISMRCCGSKMLNNTGGCPSG